MSGNEIAKLSTVINCDTRGIDRAFKLIKGGLQTADRDMTGFQRSVAKVGDALSGWKVAAVVGITAALGAMAVKATQVASQFEQLNVSFEVLTGSKEVGSALVGALTDLANVTPMTTQGLAENARLLLSFGEATNSIITDLKLLGDITGGNQEKMNSLTLAFAQSGASGRLMGQDLLQMVNAGFNPLQEISKKTGKSMGDLKDQMEKGLIPFSQVREAFKSATSEGGRFYGMMEKQSQTLNGRLSTLADKWTLVSKNMGDVFLPIAKTVVDWLVNITDAAMRATNALNKILVAKGLLAGSNNTDKAMRLQAQIDEAQKGIDRAPKYATGDPYKEQKKYIAKLKAEQKALLDDAAAANIRGKDDNKGFADGGKTSSGRKIRTPKGKSAESILSEHIQLIRSQSELEIAQNNYTEEIIL